MEQPFWKEKPLAALSDAEWESLCDGCARCCLHKLEVEETGEVFWTRVACRELNLPACRCSCYAERTQRVAGCLDLRRKPVPLHWLPPTCAYRLLAEGDDLPSWHPLRTGDLYSTREAGIAVADYAIPENEAIDLHDHVIEWQDE
jgi:uncharacterized cysteine cluster protein YcgN (CxxCxxCC family)